ncbi:MAG TPA: hypothetical protein VJV05_15290, partial [Pyrinomonadaceae bacterium]|nr:hypothetical protein [Pyrinomonadaceae bacterium]
LAGVGVGAWESVDAACAATIRIDRKIEPNPASTETLEKNYKAYKMLHAALAPAMDAIRGQDHEQQLRTETGA